VNNRATSSVLDPASGGAPPAAGAAHAKQTYSTLADVAAAAGATDSAPAKRGAMSGMTILLVVVLAAAGVLFGMRKLGLARKLQMVDFKIDYPIEKAELAKLSQDHQQVLKDLRDSGQVIQVPLDQVQTNPFEWKLVEKSVQTAPDSGALAEAAARKKAETRKKQIETLAAGLKLNSVLAGKVPLAQISGKVVRVGDTIEDVFEVKKIEGRTVTLQADDLTLELTLGEPR